MTEASSGGRGTIRGQPRAPDRALPLIALALVVPAVCGPSSVTARPALAQPSTPCVAVRDPSDDTVIVFQPPSSFAICRYGEVQDLLGVFHLFFPVRASSMDAVTGKEK